MSPTKAGLLEIAHNERNTTQHLAESGKSYSWLVDGNRYDGSTSAQLVALNKITKPDLAEEY